MAASARRRLVTYEEIAAKKAQRASAAHPLTTSIPAPVGGWNARDSLADMDARDAFVMFNLWPSTDVSYRKGYSNHATGMTNDVESLFVYSSATSNKMFAAAGTSFYNVTSSGAVGAAVVTALSNARWQYVNMTTAGGSYMYTVNGTDDPRLYDGTNWTAINGGSVPAITGVTTNTLIHVNLFKNRLWFVQKDTLKAWYLPTSAISGVATAFDLSSIARLGGYLMAIATWTIDGGAGIDDRLVFITSNGEVIVYAGSDPASSATFGLVGVWELGAPIGRRCFKKYGGDVLLLNKDGLLPLSSALQSARVDNRAAVSDKIRNAMSLAVITNGALFGWQAILYPKQSMLLVNIPRSTTSRQYAMNTLTKAWTQFGSWDAKCWELFNDDLYFGITGGTVGKAWDTCNDNGAAVGVECVQAYHYFGSPGVNKRWTLAKPNMKISMDTRGTLTGGLNVVTDFSYTGVESAPFSFTTDLLAGVSNRPFPTQGLTGIGKCAAAYLAMSRTSFSASATDTLSWMSTDYVYEKGGVIS